MSSYKRTQPAPSMQGTSAFHIHQGEALRAIAKEYPTMHAVVLEGVQNGIDAKAMRISVLIDFRDRCITIRDNGEGVSKDDFDARLRSIAKSVKEKGKLGQFGKGFVAPIDKCEFFEFTSIAQPHRRGYRQWRLANSLLKQNVINMIPFIRRDDLVYDNRVTENTSSGNVAWRSQLYIHKFTEDRLLSKMTMNNLVNDMLSNFGTAMRQHKTKISITLIPENGSPETKEFTHTEFRGEQLPARVIAAGSAGSTMFDLYVAQLVNGKRNGSVLFIEHGDVFSIPFKKLALNPNVRDMLPREVQEGLLSGLFEGRIIWGAKLNDNRTSFVSNDKLVDSLVSVEQWWNQFGRDIYIEAKEDNRHERFQMVGAQSINMIEQLYKQADPDSLIHRALQLFKIGSIGTKHFAVGGKQTEDDQTAVTTKTVRNEEAKKEKEKQQAKSGGDEGSTEKEGRSTKKNYGNPDHELPGHKPFIVRGPKGGRRKLVRGNSIGLAFQYDEMLHSLLPWELDEKTGTLKFNIRHPLWVRCEVKDRFLKSYQFKVALQALTLLTVSVDQRPSAEITFNELLKLEVEGLFLNDSWTKTAAKSSKSKKAEK